MPRQAVTSRDLNAGYDERCCICGEPAVERLLCADHLEELEPLDLLVQAELLRRANEIDLERLAV